MTTSAQETMLFTPRKAGLIGVGFTAAILIVHGFVWPNNVLHWPSYTAATAFVSVYLGWIYAQGPWLRTQKTNKEEA